jgi:hypothetical protein
MDGGRGLNILFAGTLNKMGIPQSSLRPSKGAILRDHPEEGGHAPRPVEQLLEGATHF